MDALCFDDDNKEGIEVKSAEGAPTSDFSDMDDKLGDQQVVPRVGNQYQAEIPPLIAASYPSRLIMKSRDSVKPESSSLGLDIPRTQARYKVQRSSKTLEYVTSEEGQLIAENERKLGVFSNLQSSFKFDKTPFGSFNEVKTEIDQPRGLYLLPSALSDQPWTDIEYNSFLLGLYLFGKNLNSLKRFVVSRSMGDILSFYYGKFYRSEGYCQWSKCRKLRARRRIYGKKIFAGWRQQELLSRLFSHVSGECQTMLVELSWNFGEGKMPFEEYVFALKDAVSIDLLVAAVGVGKGKKDLTMTAVKPTKTNNIFSVRPEIPIGKSCSSLTSSQIIKILTGDCRLSKARSSDLFWQAVWPRLLAKGWHSKQPKDHAVSGSNQSLVFLIPGIKKFSRRKLVKGDHYFDSISDVLNKVASDPRLLEMEIQATEGGVERERIQAKEELKGMSNKPQFRYLQPLSSKCQDPTKFTIIDTSIVSDLDKCKFRQLRSSTFQTMSKSLETEDQAEQASYLNQVEEFSGKLVKLESSDCTHTHETLNGCKEEEPSTENNEYRFIENVVLDCSKYFPSIIKKQELTAGKNGEFSDDCAESTLIDKDFNESASPSYHCGESVSSPDMISNEGSATENHMVTKVSAEKPETKMLIDLNLPLIPPHLEFEMAVPSSMVTPQNNDNQCENVSQEEEQPMVVNRRHSTRNRPLTRKALEALECGFLNSKRKRKKSESSYNDSNSQCLDVISGTIMSATCDDGIGNAMADISVEKENVIQACSSSINLNNEADYSL